MLRSIVLLSLLAVAGVAPAAAQAPAIEVDHAWARATPAGARTAALYLTLVNKGASSDRLVAVSTPVAGKAEVHSSTTENGVMQMRPVAALEVKPDSRTVLKPGGYHVMLMELKGPLKEGQSFAITLTFEKAGAVEATATVEKLGAAAMPGMKM
jgi:copper(I)-binding protein